LFCIKVVCNFAENKISVMGEYKKKAKVKRVVRQHTTEDYLKEAVGFSEEDKAKLRSGEGFVKVPSEELKRLRIDAYNYLM
jgi:hypothetical protein